MFDDDWLIEHYKVVVRRQEYHSDRMWIVFTFYYKALATLIFAAIALISAKEKLEIQKDDFLLILDTIASTISFIGFISIILIGMSLKSWIGYRRYENKIDPKIPQESKYWWLYETFYCIIIIVSVIMCWVGLNIILKK